MTHSIQNAKARAKRLRKYMDTKGQSISHSFALEAIAAEEGYRDWNTLAACADTVLTRSTGFPLQVGESVSGLYHETAFEGVLIGLEQTINKHVWRVKIQFKAPVSPTSLQNIGMTRRRITGSVNTAGVSVNLLGKEDEQLRLFIGNAAS